MDAINTTQQQRDALEIRTYLQDRALMQYADMFEASGKSLPELLNLSTGDLSSQFGSKSDHMTWFMDRTSACSDPMPKLHALPARNNSSIPSRNNSIYKGCASVKSAEMQSARGSLSRTGANNDKSLKQSLADFKIQDGYTFKGIVAAGPAEPRACGLLQAPPVTEQVAPYSAIENIPIQKLTPEYKIGMGRLMKTETPPMKTSDLWREKPAALLCINVLGASCAELKSEVKDFWPRYCGGAVVYNQGKEFFKALWGGKLLLDKFLSGFVLNPRAIANYKSAKAIGVEQNFKGNGQIKGGLFIVGRGRSGIAYQFIQRNFGDWAPLAEVIEICTQLQNQQQDQLESIKTMQE